MSINLIVKLACEMNDNLTKLVNLITVLMREHLDINYFAINTWFLWTHLLGGMVILIYGMRTLMIWSSAQFVYEASSLIHKHVACVCWQLERLEYLSAILGEKVISYLLGCFRTKSMKSVLTGPGRKLQCSAFALW